MNAGRVIVVGGGASGVILAAHLLRLPGRALRVTIVEERPEIGRGVAYATNEPDHVLNTRAASMSAFGDDAEHFWRWLLASGAVGDIRCSDPFCFVPRRLFARYLADLVKPWLAASGDGRLSVVRGGCAGIRSMASGVAVELSDGTSHPGHVAVLATGHDIAPPSARGAYVSPWIAPVAQDLAGDGDVLVIGTGLSMVDTVIELVNRGHRGRITALSRHGLLPRSHRRNSAMRIDAADVPFGTDISYLLRWFRRTAIWAMERGGDWRDVVDGVRPHTSQLWHSLPIEARRRFLRHARAWWEVHRHRLPPESEERILAAMANGVLDIVAGRFVDCETSDRGIRVRYRRRGAPEPETAIVAKIVDCTGILRDPEDNRAGLVSSLIAKGAARPDPCRIGIEVDHRCAVIDAAGHASRRLFAVGPVTRARFWEVTAVPDIRVQCAALADTIAAMLADEPQAAHPTGRAPS